MVKANSALQTEGLAVLMALEEADARREAQVKSFTDSEMLVKI